MALAPAFLRGIDGGIPRFKDPDRDPPVTIPTRPTERYTFTQPHETGTLPPYSKANPPASKPTGKHGKDGHKCGDICQPQSGGSSSTSSNTKFGVASVSSSSFSSAPSSTPSQSTQQSDDASSAAHRQQPAGGFWSNLIIFGGVIVAFGLF